MYPEHLQKFIPPYFDLANYDATANMELIYWLDNLIKRAKPYKCALYNDDLFDSYKFNSDNEEDGSLYEFISEGLNEKELFEKDVIQNILNGALLDENVHNFVNVMFLEEDNNFSSIVTEMTHVDLISLEKSKLTNDMKEKYSTVDRSFIPALTEKNFGDLNDPIHSHDINNEIEFSWLKVDMSCSDSEIRVAFNEWLKQHRDREKSLIQQKRRVHKLKIINETTLRKWHQAKVLPYIDLVTWNFLTNQKVSSNAIGEILFPNPRLASDRAKMVDDTTKPYAEKLTSERFIRRAIKLVVDEKRKKSS